jgi:hypothetical protein
MRSIKTLIASALALAVSTAAFAELQNVEVGGSIQIRHNWYDFDDAGEEAYIEQRTRLSVKADFTDEVTAFIEFDSYDIWGTSFRSNWLTGADGPGGASVDVYQAYVEADQMWGTPLRLRVGRQEMSFGSEWLVGVNNVSSGFWGLSFDALRLDYTTDMFSVAVWGAKLAENFGDFGRDDTDFYGVYGSYTGLEDFVIDAYWMFVRDDRVQTAFKSNLHTIGLRGAGTFGAFDLEAEVAYQFGDIKRSRGTGFFRRNRKVADFDAWGANLEAGYTFDTAYQPRLFLGYAFFEGAAGRDLAFNRLFSNWEYTEFFANTDESNLHIGRAGFSIMPTEAIELALVAGYFDTHRPVERRFLWWRNKQPSRLGWELGLYGDYHYSEDLVFRGGFAHFFASSGVASGNFVVDNGLSRLRARDSSNFNYLFLETEIKF